jgi:pilus assembly protein CpaC
MSINQVPKILPGQETRNPDDYELFLEGILEAPRGPRTVCPDGKYTPAFKNGPSAGQIPCAGGYGNGACGAGGCGNGSGNGYGEPLGSVAPVNGQPAPANGPVNAPANGPVSGAANAPAAPTAATPPANGGTPAAVPGGQTLPGAFPGGAAGSEFLNPANTSQTRLVPPGGPR